MPRYLAEFEYRFNQPSVPARETTLRDWLLIEEVRFAADSPLEGDGFEPSVPRQKDVCKHRDRRRSRAPGAQIGGKMANNADLAPSGNQPLIIRCGRSVKLAEFCERSRAGARDLTGSDRPGAA